MIKAFRALSLALVITLGWGSVAFSQIEKMHKEMLYPVVQVETTSGIGS